MTPPQEVTTSLRDGVVTISLNAPDRLNALTPAMLEAILQVLQQPQSGARAILLRGKGRGFCSGVDLASTGTVPTPDLDGGAILETHVNPVIEAMRASRVPIVCGLHGVVAGLGVALALSCDMIVMSRSSYLLAPYARIGLVPDGGVAALLTRAAGRVRAMHILLGAERVDAARALDWGLVSDVVDDADLQTRAERTAHRLAAGPTMAIAAIRNLVWAADEDRFSDSLRSEREMQRTMPATLDCREGHRAFVEKRAPHFVGH